ncbi:hypothetical protein U9M48_018889 [Paspalum notatum var. saurae]|uniref:Uncharacterized protein n=1 Tax=Paspalum notatum var. saurae TaxID=547442 RepID=A0AAQ3TDU0_PASNO
MVPREVNLKEKRMYVPFPMVEEPYFSMPVEVAPPVQPTVVATPAVDVGSPSTTVDEQEIVPVPEPPSPAATPEPQVPAPDAAEAEGPEQEIVLGGPPPEQPQVEEQDVPVRRSQRVRRSAIPDDYEVYVCEEMSLEGDPTAYEEVMRSPDSSKWLAAMEDEMRSMDTNKAWDLKEIPKGAKKVDWAWCKDTKKSTSGYVFTLAGGAVSWKTCKQSIVASSTMYTEIIACFEAMGHAMWLKKFIPSLRVVYSIEKPLKIYCDNSSAVDYFHNSRSSGATKHIDIKFYVVKEKI